MSLFIVAFYYSINLVKVICDYLAKSCQWGNVPANTKYVIMEMMSRGRHPDHRRVSMMVVNWVTAMVVGRADGCTCSIW